MDKIGLTANGILSIEHGLALGLKGFNHISYLINKDGIIKEVNYEKTINYVAPFSPLTIFKENDLIGIIDDKCEIIIPPIFKNINNFNSSYSIAEYPNCKFAIINIYGKIINIKTRYENVCLTKDRSIILGFIGKRINLINELGEDIQFPIEIKEIVNDSLPLLVIEKETNFFYFLDSKGLLFCKDGYEKAFPFNDCYYTWVKQGNYWYLIDKEGEVISNTDKFEIISKYYPNGTLCRNKNNGNICIIDKNICLIEEINNTSRIAPKKSSDVNYRESSEYYYFFIEGHTYKYIEGILYKIPFIELDIISTFVFNKNIIDRKSIKILKGYPLTFSRPNNGSFYVFNIFTQEFIEIKLEEGEVIKKGFINEIDSYLIIEGKGKKYIISLSTKKKSDYFISYYPLYGGLRDVFIIKKENKLFYLLDSKLNIVSEGYERIKYCTKNFYIAEKYKEGSNNKNKVYGLIDNTGKEILPFEYDYLSFTPSRFFRK